MNQTTLEELRQALSPSPPPPVKPDRRQAAVILPLLFPPETMIVRHSSILFTLRTMEVPTHKGHVSFPGGAIEVGETPATAALRECEEELGITRTNIDLLGCLGTFPTLTSGWEIQAFVGWFQHLDFTPSPREVERLFQIPLPRLLAHRQELRNLAEKTRPWPTFPHQEGDQHFTIWGATARITSAFLDLMRTMP